METTILGLGRRRTSPRKATLATIMEELRVDRDDTPRRALINACYQDRADLLKQLISILSTEDVTHSMNEVCRHLGDDKRTVSFMELGAHKADLNEVLETVCRLKEPGLLCAVLRHGVDPNKRADRLTQVLVQKSDVTIAQMLLDAGFMPNPWAMYSCQTEEQAQIAGLFWLFWKHEDVSGMKYNVWKRITDYIEGQPPRDGAKGWPTFKHLLAAAASQEASTKKQRLL